MTDSAALTSMDNPEFDQLDAILDDMRQRDEEIPQWEFLEGAMAALACSRASCKTSAVSAITGILAVLIGRKTMLLHKKHTINLTR